MAKQSLTEFDEAEIRFQMPLLTQRQVVFHRWKDRLVFVALMAILPVGFATLQSLTGPADDGPLHEGQLFVFLLGGMVDCGFLLLIGYDDNAPGWYSWLQPAHCAELAALCDTHPDLADFRDHVAAMGRRFTYGEYCSMKQWPDYKKQLETERHKARSERAACQQLYKLTEN